MSGKLLFAIILILNSTILAQEPDTAWTKTFGGADLDRAYSVRPTLDGGYILTGFTKSYGAGWCDVWLIKTDENGIGLWSKVFGGADYDRGHSVQQTSDSGYIISGFTNSIGAGETDFWLIKTVMKFGIKHSVGLIMIFHFLLSRLRIRDIF